MVVQYWALWCQRMKAGTQVLPRRFLGEGVQALTPVSSGTSRAVTQSPPDGAASAVSDGGLGVGSSRLGNGVRPMSRGVTNERRIPDAASAVSGEGVQALTPFLQIHFESCDLARRCLHASLLQGPTWKWKHSL